MQFFLRKYFSSAVLQQRSSFLGVGKREYEKRNPVEQRKKALTLLRIYERIFKRLWAKVNAFQRIILPEMFCKRKACGLLYTHSFLFNTSHGILIQEIQCPLDIATLDIAVALPIATSTTATDLRHYINNNLVYNDLRFRPLLSKQRPLLVAISSERSLQPKFYVQKCTIF